MHAAGQHKCSSQAPRLLPRPVRSTHHHLANARGPCVTSSGTRTPAVKAATAARLIFTLPCSAARYLLTSKCQICTIQVAFQHSVHAQC